MEKSKENQTEIVQIEKEMNEEKIDFNQPEIASEKKIKEEVDSARSAEQITQNDMAPQSNIRTVEQGESQKAASGVTDEKEGSG